MKTVQPIWPYLLLLGVGCLLGAVVVAVLIAVEVLI